MRDLYEQSGISSIIVAGSSGSYFHVADTILQMKEYKPYDITEKAKKQAEQFPAIHTEHATYRLPQWKRCPAPGKELKNMDRMKLKVLGREAISLNRSTTDLRYVEQLADSEQLATWPISCATAQAHLMDGRKNMLQIVDFVEKLMDEKGLAALCESSYLPSNLARPRRQEIFACINPLQRPDIVPKGGSRFPIAAAPALFLIGIEIHDSLYHIFDIFPGNRFLLSL